VSGVLALLVGLVVMAEAELEKAEPAAVQQDYLEHCAKCHGPDGKPRKIAKGAPDVKDAKWKEGKSLEEIQKTIAEGKGKIMPKFGRKLTSEEIEALARFVSRFGESGTDGEAKGP
jgi:cytochrome c oxidase cbb3-type subunit 3